MKNKKLLEDLFLITMIGISVLIVCALIGIEIYVWITYRNTPISELPMWVLFFMFGGRK